MKNTKLLSAATSIALAIALVAPVVLAEDQILPDVENLIVEAVPSGAHLIWDPVAGADGYTIYYGIQSISEDGASYENDILLGDVTEYTINELTPGVTYYFSAAADDTTGTYLGSYNYSEEVSVVAGDAVVVPVDPDPVVPIIPEEAPVVDLVDPDPVAPIIPEEALVVDPVDPVDSVVDTEPSFPAADDESVPTPEPESLPQSGPATAAVALVSSAGAYFWRKFRK